jgi:hypothetical protein
MTESPRMGHERDDVTRDTVHVSSEPIAIQVLHMREPSYQPPDFLSVRVVAREYVVLLARIGVVLCVGGAVIATIYLLNTVYRSSSGESQRLIATLPIVIAPLMLVVKHWPGWSRPERPRGRPEPPEHLD